MVRSVVAWKIDALLGLVASLRSEGDEALTQAERAAESSMGNMGGMGGLF